MTEAMTETIAIEEAYLQTKAGAQALIRKLETEVIKSLLGPVVTPE